MALRAAFTCPAPVLGGRNFGTEQKCTRRPRVVYALVKTKPVEAAPKMPSDNALTDFQKQISLHPLLTRAEEQLLARQITPLRVHERIREDLKKEGKPYADVDVANALGLSMKQFIAKRGRAMRARDKLVTANLRLVVKIAYRIKGGSEVQDLVQEGCMALIRAAERFEAGNGSFASFAFKAVWRRCRRADSPASSIVKVPERLRVAMKRGEDIGEAAQFLRGVSLDQEITTNGGGGTRIMDLVKGGKQPEEVVQEGLLSDAIEKACSRWLSKRDADIVLAWHSGRTMKQIGKAVGLTEARVSQICKKAVRVLREKDGGLRQAWNEM